MDDHAAIRQSLDAFYRTFSAATDGDRDWDALRSLLSPGACVLRAPRDASSAGGIRAVSVDEYVDQLSGSLSGRRFFERGFDYDIRVHDDLAQVSSRYEFGGTPTFESLDGSGTNLILLARQSARWRIVSMVYQNDA